MAEVDKAKRARGAEGDAAGMEEEPSDWKAHMDSAVANAFAGFLPKVQGIMAQQIGEVRELYGKHDTIMAKHTKQIEGRGERQVELTNEQRELRIQVRAMQEQLAVDEENAKKVATGVGRPVLAPPLHADYFDPTMLRINSAKLVGIERGYREDTRVGCRR